MDQNLVALDQKSGLMGRGAIKRYSDGWREDRKKGQALEQKKNAQYSNIPRRKVQPPLIKGTEFKKISSAGDSTPSRSEMGKDVGALQGHFWGERRAGNEVRPNRSGLSTQGKANLQKVERRGARPTQAIYSLKK